MKSRPYVLAAIVAIGAVASAGHAAPKPGGKIVTLTDVTGDANGANGQGVVSTGSAGTAGPAQNGAYDVKSLTFASDGTLTKKKVGRKTVTVFTCTGYTVTMELAQAPAAQLFLYRVRGTTATNDDLFWLQYGNDGTTTTTRLRHAGGGAATVAFELAKPAEVQGSKIIFRISLADLKKAGEKQNTMIAGLGADTRNTLVAATVPQWDEVVSENAFKVCD